MHHSHLALDSAAQNALALAELQTAESSGYHKGRIRMYVTLKMAKPRSVALKTAEDPGREGFAAEGSIGHIATGREQDA